MPNLGYGHAAGDVPALRIAFDNATDLVNEPASSYGKFQFDSLNGSKLSYVYEIDTFTYDSRWRTGGYLDALWFFSNHDKNSGTGGSDLSNSAGAMVQWSTFGSGSQPWYLFSAWWPFGYLPICETRLVKGTNLDTFDGPTLSLLYYASGQGYIESFAGAANYAQGLVNTNLFSATNNVRECWDVLTRNNGTNQVYMVSAFQLPAREDPLPDYSLAPVSGQGTLLLTPTIARLALPGRDVSSPDPNHYIFHEARIPAKIMRAGDVDVAFGGTATIMCPLALTPYTYMDYMVKRQSDAEYWNPPYFRGKGENQKCSFTYQVLSDRVVITNTADFDISIRYVIFADSDVPQTTGGKKVEVVGNDGTRDYVQIKRPGSSDLAPGLNDIIVDTRLSYMPILAEGFLPWTSGFPTVVSGGNLFKGERMATISIANPAPKLKLFVKQGVVFKSNCYPASCRWNYHRVFADSGTYSDRCSQDSSWARISADESAVDFYMAGANPLNWNAGSQRWIQEWPSQANTVALGLRFYIFGIPANL